MTEWLWNIYLLWYQWCSQEGEGGLGGETPPVSCPPDAPPLEGSALKICTQVYGDSTFEAPPPLPGMKWNGGVPLGGAPYTFFFWLCYCLAPITTPPEQFLPFIMIAVEVQYCFFPTVFSTQAKTCFIQCGMTTHSPLNKTNSEKKKTHKGSHQWALKTWNNSFSKTFK